MSRLHAFAPSFFLEPEYSQPVVYLWRRVYRIHHPGFSFKPMLTRDRWHLMSGVPFVIDILIVKNVLVLVSSGVDGLTSY